MYSQPHSAGCKWVDKERYSGSAGWGLGYGANNPIPISSSSSSTIEIKTNVIPVTIGATGTTLKSFSKYLSNILGKHEIKELYKTDILSTSHILQEVLT